MRKYSLLLSHILIFFLAVLFAGCGSKSGRFKISGKFLNLNQGEFYVYSPDGAIDGMDTIKVQGGRFSYDIACHKEGTLIIVFPNFSQQPVFTKPGGSVDISGDASHIKEMKVEGTKDNELMTKFRKATSQSTPPDVIAAARRFVADNPDSYVCTYIIRNFFIETASPDYASAAKLTAEALKAQPGNGYLLRIGQSVKNLGRVSAGKPLPAFKTVAADGSSTGSGALSAAPVAVVYVWASWNFNSLDMQRSLKDYKRRYGSRLALMGINMDADKAVCQRNMKADSITWPTVSDGRLFDGSAARSLGVTYVPDNIVLQHGRVVAGHLPASQLREQLDRLLR